MPEFKNTSSKLARDFGAMLLVGASFFPAKSGASDREHFVEHQPTPTVSALHSHLNLSDPQILYVPERRAPLNLSAGNEIPRDHSPFLGIKFLDSLLAAAQQMHEAMDRFKVGTNFSVPGPVDNLEGNLALTSKGAVKFSVSGLSHNNSPRIDLVGDPFSEGGKVGIKITIF